MLQGNDEQAGSGSEDSVGALDPGESFPPTREDAPPKKGPARIKLSLSRPLSFSEREWLLEQQDWCFTSGSGAIKTMITYWEPHSKHYRVKFYPFRVRLSKNEQLYLSSNNCDSRFLYNRALRFLKDAFVNIHPTAVKTLRELG